MRRLRENIDQVDSVLVKLLNQRAQWALDIGEVKKGANLPIYQPDREKAVLARVQQLNRGPLGEAAVQRLFERIIDGLDVPVIPVHLDQVWGSIFSFKDGKFFWKWPKRFFYPVTITFGSPLPAICARTNSAWLSLNAATANRTPGTLPYTIRAAFKNTAKLFCTS